MFSSIDDQVKRVKTMKFYITGVLVLLASVAVADRAADETAIRKALGQLSPDTIETTPVAGIYEVAIGPHIVYVTADGRYMFQGDLIDVLMRTSLTEPSRRLAVKKAVDAVSEKDMIIFEPKKVKHTITVFTDIDCGYCRKLHNEMQDFLDAGIRVRYMFYPRAGVGSPSYKKAVAVWCADDRLAALTAAKKDQALELETCKNPIDEHMALVDKLGARGTPFIVFENGQTQPGYLPAKQMARLLDQQTPAP